MFAGYPIGEVLEALAVWEQLKDSTSLKIILLKAEEEKLTERRSDDLERLIEITTELESLS